MPYTIQVLPAAPKALAKLPKKDARRIGAKIAPLATNPRPYGAKKLRGDGGLLRVRVGDYRIVYLVEDREHLVLVVKIGHRREVYR